MLPNLLQLGVAAPEMGSRFGFDLRHGNLQGDDDDGARTIVVNSQKSSPAWYRGEKGTPHFKQENPLCPKGRKKSRRLLGEAIKKGMVPEGTAPSLGRKAYSIKAREECSGKRRRSAASAKD